MPKATKSPQSKPTSSGEFRFKELDEAAYTVRAKVDGYEDVVLAADTTEEDVVLGDIFLSAAA